MATKLSLLPFFCVLFFLFSHTKGKFDNDTLKRLQGCQKGTKVQGLHNLKLYLARFGYLNYQHTPNHINSENDEFDQELESALISYQNFYHLNASGTLDEPTISQMNKPRCGVPDKKNSHTHGTKLLHIVSHYQFLQGNPKWPSTKTHLTFAFDLTYPDVYVAPVARAFTTWASATGYFTFSRIADVTNSDIKISFGRGDHGDNNDFKANVLAHAFPPPDGRFHYNADKTWSEKEENVPNAYNVQSVALHEIGHLLGLGHSEDQNAIMWSGLDAGVVKGLTQDDVQGIKALYGV